MTSITRLPAPVPLPILLMVLSFLCPSELSLYLAGLRLPPHRVALLLLLPIALYRMAASRSIRLGLQDHLILGFAAISLAAYAAHGEFVYGGSVALEAFASYAIARVWVRDAASFMATLKLLIVATLAAGLLALPETLTGKYFIHDLLRCFVPEALPPIEKRLGFYRAASVFDHPIHLGTFCASLLALIWTAERRKGVRTACLAICVFSTLTALSSAPILCLCLQAGLLVTERVTRGVAGRIALVIAAIFCMYLGASIVSNRSPMAIVATGFTIDAWTGFYRLNIWEYGLNTVWRYPLLGIGQGDWERPSWMASATVDAFWLVLAMRTGIPSLLLLIGGIVLMVVRAIASRRRSRDPVLRRIAVGWVVSLIALSMAAATVHLWNVVFAYYFFFLGLSGWIVDPMKAAAVAPIPQTHRKRGRGWSRPSRGPLPPPLPVHRPVPIVIT